MNDAMKLEAQRNWFKQAGYGMMVHWGLYALLAGEHRGRIARPYSEWIQSQFAIPNAEYERLAGIFNPIYFDADAWVRLAKDCGMRYVVVTAKHHDGFAMTSTASSWGSTTPRTWTGTSPTAAATGPTTSAAAA